jgi:SMC interacting uncharacterized protein involved in chromosome segregation
VKRYYEIYAYRTMPTQFAMIFADVTERKAAEDALRENIEELERLNHAMVGRELRMVELKKEVNKLCNREGEPQRYRVDFEKEE